MIIYNKKKFQYTVSIFNCMLIGCHTRFSCPSETANDVVIYKYFSKFDILSLLYFIFGKLYYFVYVVDLQ